MSSISREFNSFHNNAGFILFSLALKNKHKPKEQNQSKTIDGEIIDHKKDEL